MNKFASSSGLRNAFLRRAGHTVAECLAAFAMLAPIAVLVTKIDWQNDRANRDNSLAAAAHRDLINARETVGSWDFETVSQANIESIDIPLDAEFKDRKRTWLVVVQDVTAPITAKQVTLSMRWNESGQTPVQEAGPITFWVPKP
jgi:hypothetical protein